MASCKSTRLNENTSGLNCTVHGARRGGYRFSGGSGDGGGDGAHPHGVTNILLSNSRDGPGMCKRNRFAAGSKLQGKPPT